MLSVSSGRGNGSFAGLPFENVRSATSTSGLGLRLVGTGVTGRLWVVYNSRRHSNS